MSQWPLSRVAQSSTACCISFVVVPIVKLPPVSGINGEGTMLGASVAAAVPPDAGGLADVSGATLVGATVGEEVIGVPSKVADGLGTLTFVLFPLSVGIGTNCVTVGAALADDPALVGAGLAVAGDVAVAGSGVVVTTKIVGPAATSGVVGGPILR